MPTITQGGIGTKKKRRFQWPGFIRAKKVAMAEAGALAPTCGITLGTLGMPKYMARPPDKEPSR